MANSGTDDSGASESDDNEDHRSEIMDEVCDIKDCCGSD
jgi:hypothetical protein